MASRHPTPPKSFLRRHFLVLAVSLIVVVLAIVYIAGYRPGPGLSFVRVGTLLLKEVPAGATVYANERPRAHGSGGDVRISLVPGSHSIIIDMPGAHPWNDVITIEGAQETVAHPIRVSKEVTLHQLAPEERAHIPALLNTQGLPSAASPLSLLDGCAQVFVSNNRILATGTTTDSCTPPPYLCVTATCGESVIFDPVASIRSVIPHPLYPDALIVSYGSMVAVLELNPVSPQFFAPLYQETPALVFPWSDTSVVLIADNTAYELSF